ncbi:fimbria/pilus outer membrane usher protein, partial [Erwinia sp. V71]|uniref:fimbria/pilus outer membrane usher protein n=1 Tax=Erwinia sp. V71 TaxID=3369424 RepID=UPI003F5E4842
DSLSVANRPSIHMTKRCTYYLNSRSDFDFSLGALRHNYGSASADYNAASVSGLWRYGLTDSLSLSTHAEGREGLATGGVGADIALGLLGTLSTSISHSSPDGQQLSVGYSYYGRRFSLSAQHLQRSRGYSDLSVYDTSATLSRRTDQLTLSTTPFGQWGGSLGLGYFDIEAQDGTRTRLVNLSWSRSIWGASSLYLALKKTLGSNDATLLAQLVIPLGDSGTASTSIQRDSSGKLSERLTYNRAAPASGGLGWNVGLSTGNSDYRQADLTWKNDYSVISGGFYGEPGAQNSWLDMAGSLIFMDNAFFATNKVSDAFIVVSTDGYPDIPVSYENRLIGSTDTSGHLLVPWASAWYPAKLSIDTLSLPATVTTPNVEKRVAVREGSGALVTFPVQKERSALIKLVDEHHQPLPPGTLVTETVSGQTAAIGYDGLAWFSHLATQNEIVVSLSTGNCHHTFPLAEDSDIASRIGPLVCSTH